MGRAERTPLTSAGAAVLATLPLLLLLGGLFVVPVFGIRKDSLVGAAGLSFEHYAHLWITPVYRQVLGNTLLIAGLVTLFAVIPSYPLAYLLATVGPTAAKILLVVTLTLFFVSDSASIGSVSHDRAG